MKRLVLVCSLFLILVLAACGTQSSAEEEVADDGNGPMVTVYRAPT